MVVKKHDIEEALRKEQQAISQGRLKEDSPLDTSEDFRIFCEACRRGDLKACQERIQDGININARDRFDYTPLILASLCGHFEVVQLLLESGALCERDTFQGERCLYNALNDKIRNLLLSYDYSKSRDPLQPLAGHITSLLYRDRPHTSDITLATNTRAFHLHKFILSARSPYFAKKLAATPDTITWRVPDTIPSQSLEIVIVGLYFGEITSDFTGSDEDQEVLVGIEKLGRILEIKHILDAILEGDRRLARQLRSEEVSRGQKQIETWFQKNILGNRLVVDSVKVDSIKWDRQNNLFADVLLCVEYDEEEAPPLHAQDHTSRVTSTFSGARGIPVGPSARSLSQSPVQQPRRSQVVPAHRAMLLRSEYFAAMFSSSFREAQEGSHLPVVRLDCTPEVLEVVLAFLYTEQANFGLDLAIDVLFAGDQLFIEKLKTKAAIIISTLGNGAASVVEPNNAREETNIEDVVDIYDVIRAGWDTRVHRLEEFGARYMAYRLEKYIDKEEFRRLVQESAARIQRRQETDTVELVDDIRYYLSERFRLRFEDAGLDELEEQEQLRISLENTGEDGQVTAEALSSQSTSLLSVNDSALNNDEPPHDVGVIRTLNGDEAGDEFAQDAMNYQILLGKIDTLLESLKLDA